MPLADNAAAAADDDDDDDEVKTYDQCIGANVNLPIGERMMSGKVRGQESMSDGSLVGNLNANPILDTKTYKVEFAYGQTVELAANVMAHNMYAICNIGGNRYC